MKIYIDGELPKSCASCLFLMHCDECEGHENYCMLIGHVGYDPSDNLIDGAPVTPSSERHEDCPLEQLPRGKWTEEFDESANPFFQRRWRCSACNDYNYYGRPDFCPCCGADMREGDPDDRA